MQEKLSDFVVGCVRRAGVRHVFLVPGGGAMHLDDSLGNSGLGLVHNLHEQASAIACEAYAKVTGELGAAFVTSGPGGTNAVTGVAGAWLDSTPCVFVSGQAKRADLKGDTGVRSMGVQEVDIVSIVRPVTKYAVTITEPESIRFHMEKALHLASSGRPGPVWIDIPLDVQGSRVDVATQRGFDPNEPATPDRSEELRQQVADAVRLLEVAERPVLLVGNGVRLARGEQALGRILEQLGIPVLLTWLAIDLLGDDHPLFFGRPGAVAPRGANFAVQNADCLFSVGARLDRVLTGYSHENFARGARKIVVDVDPAELDKLGMRVDVRVCADARDFLVELSRQWEGRPRVACEPWKKRCRDWRARYPIVLPEHRARTGRTSVYALADVLSEESASTDIIVSGSSGAGIETFLHAYRVRAGQRILHTTALGAMGFAIPMAVGAAVATGRRTIVVDGDGGFQFNVQELETVRRLGLPIKFFVLDNEGYSSIRTSQKGYFGRLVGADASSGLTLPDVTRVAAAYGLAAARIDDQRDLRGRVREVLATDGPLVCNVAVIPDEDRLPRISSRPLPNGSMISTPLEDLFPYLPRDEFFANMIVAPLDQGA
jgi:acetolactate synthase-1/2/3 large subunit